MYFVLFVIIVSFLFALHMTSCLPSIALFVSVPLFADSMVAFLVNSVIIWFDLSNVVISLL